MSTFQIHFRANPALWPTDPQDSLALWERSAQGADAMLESGALRDLYFVSAAEGYANVDADSKSAAIAVCAAFFPNFTQEIQELVPWDQAKEAILGSARQVASS